MVSVMSKKNTDEKIYFTKDKLKRAGYIGLSLAGFLGSGFFPSEFISIPIASIFVTSAIVNGTMRGYDDLLVRVSSLRGNIGQNTLMCSRDNIRQLRKIINGIDKKSDNEKNKDIAALMVDQMILLTDREKKRLKGKKTKEVIKSDGTKINEFKKSYKTCTHSINIGTLLQLHEMGYINIKSIDFKKKSNLQTEKFTVDVVSKGFFKAVAKKLLGKSKSKGLYDMYNIKFTLTDKQMDYDKIIETLNDKNKGCKTISNDIKTNFLSNKESRMSQQEKAKCEDIRRKSMLKHTQLAKLFMKNGLAMVNSDGMKYKYVSKDSNNSILQNYENKKKIEEMGSSWSIDKDLIKEINRENIKCVERYNEQKNINKENECEPKEI